MQNRAQRLCSIALATTLAGGAEFAQSPPVFSQSVMPTPTPTVALPGAMPSAQPTSSAQSTSDQIAAIASQVAQVVKDPSMPVDTKSQQVLSLASQFNQLVLVWQQQASMIGGTAAPLPGLVAQPTQSQPTPTPAPFANATPTPLTGQPTIGAVTADQVRSQIAGVTRQMAQVSQDTSLSAEVKTAQLSALGDQFNQLMVQLKQLGG